MLRTATTLASHTIGVHDQQGLQTQIARFNETIRITMHSLSRKEAIEGLLDVASRGVAVRSFLGYLKRKSIDITPDVLKLGLTKVTLNTKELGEIIDLLPEQHDGFFNLNAETTDFIAKNYPRESVPLLIQLLNNNKLKHSKFPAAMCLGKIGSDAQNAVPHLIKVVESGKFDSNTGGEIAKALGAISPRDKTLVPVLRKLLHGGNTSVYEAAKVLGEIGSGAKEAIPDLEEAALELRVVDGEESSPYTKEFVHPNAAAEKAIEAIGKIGGEESLNALTRLLQKYSSSYTGFTGAVAEALGHMGKAAKSKQVREGLIDALEFIERGTLVSSIISATLKKIG